jgi:N-acetylglucosaminyl-diphospho-decaprenol L-rhamnosyltransferase
VTVVDNASSDGSANGLDDLPLPLELIRNSRNVGFARACNQGAADSTADYLLFLNPDTRLFPDTLAAVTKFMESEQAGGIGVCGVQVVDDAGAPAISCARFPTLRVLFGEMTGLHLLVPQLFPGHHLTAAETPSSQVVDQVIGAFYFVQRELFARLGGFDERYFLYFEEVDFALRARRHGARSYFLKEARIFHAENVSSNQVRGTRLYHSLRSRFLFARRHWPRWQANLLVVLTLTVELTARLARAALRRSGSDVSATASAYGRLLGDLLRSGPGLAERSNSTLPGSRGT